MSVLVCPFHVVVMSPFFRGFCIVTLRLCLKHLCCSVCLLSVFSVNVLLIHFSRLCVVMVECHTLVFRWWIVMFANVYLSACWSHLTAALFSFYIPLVGFFCLCGHEISRFDRAVCKAEMHLALNLVLGPETMLLHMYVPEQAICLGTGHTDTVSLGSANCRRIRQASLPSCQLAHRRLSG